jgi:hypothetical protein
MRDLSRLTPPSEIVQIPLAAVSFAKRRKLNTNEAHPSASPASGQ